MATGVKKEGYLRKEGGKHKNWRRRWCVLQPSSGTLFYHVKKGGKLKGKISLRFCGQIRPINYKKKKFCFAIETPEREWHIIAETPQDMNDWIAELKKVRDYFKASEENAELKKSKAAPSGPTTKPGPMNGSSPMSGGSTTTTTTTATSMPTSTASTPNGNSNGNGSGSGSGSGKISEDSFAKLKVIGRGSFGKVFKVQKKDSGEVFAMKVLNKVEVAERNELMHARSENSILRKLDCPFLVHMHYAFQTPDKLYFIMDFVNGGELFFHLQKEGKFNEERVRFYVAEIVLGLEYLHNKGIIYRDLKPENLLLSADGHIIMTDFGISKEGLAMGSDRTSTFCGTPEYLAPEVLKQEKYTKAVDWWSLGTLMFEMLSGLPPFYTEDVQNMYYNIINTKLTMPKGSNEDAQSLLNGFLEKDPLKRLSDPADIKKHPFFKGIDWEKLYAKAVKPPYIPPVKSKVDDSQISPEFTEDSIEDVAPPQSKMNQMRQQPIHFEGFTFVGAGRGK